MKNIFKNRDYNTFQDNIYDRKMNRSMFDLSHANVFTMTMGQLAPFLTLRTLPGDTFKCRVEIMSRFATLHFPIFTRIDVSIWYFYTPNRILWDQWELFITQNNAGDLLHPVFNMNQTLLDQGDIVNLLPTYMGVPTNPNYTAGTDVTQITINAFPVAAYWKVYDEYFRNPQLQQPMFQPLVEGENPLYAYALGLQFLAIRNWNRDYFTSALPTPQVGSDVLVPMFNPDYNRGIAGIYESPDGPWRVKKVEDGVVPAGDIVQGDWTGATDDGMTVGGDPVYLDIQETAATMRQFRLAARLLEYLEQLMKVGNRYRDWLKGMWHTDPNPSAIDDPVYIGGGKGRVVISEVLATAETLDGAEIATSVGNYSGQALALESSNTLTYTCGEHGILLGIINMQPKSSYYQGLGRMWTDLMVLDYPFEHFANIGDQEILHREVNYNWTTAGHLTTNLETFGYIGRYDDWRFHNDIVAGYMRSTLFNYHLSRSFIDNAVMFLNSEFITCVPRTSDVFEIAPGEHEIYCNIWNDVTVLRQLPKHGVPKL